jgi:hypothetical protein
VPTTIAQYQNKRPPHTTTKIREKRNKIKHVQKYPRNKKGNIICKTTPLKESQLSQRQGP